VLVPVLAALLDEDGLVDAVVLEGAQGGAQLLRGADAAGAAAQHLQVELGAHREELVPDVRAPRPMLAEDVVVAEGELEEAEALGTATARLLAVRMA
jgi:hypothetical protein